MEAPPLTIAPKELWLGDQTLLAGPTAAVLNSRQNRYPFGDDPWVKQTVEACKWLSNSQYTLMTSTGLKTWELALWAAGETMGSVVVLLGVPENTGAGDIIRKLNETLDSFRLVRQYSLIVPYFYPLDKKTEKDSWKQRDRWILHHASKLLPVSLRPNSTLMRAIQNDGLTAKIDPKFQIDHKIRPHTPPPPPSSEKTRQISQDIDWEYVTHWTRTSGHPWEDETHADYYESLVASRGEYPRSAMRTLCHILDTQLIRASAWRMPLKRPMVSFTAEVPEVMVREMRWRRRYVRYSFEPYGIAIPMETIRKLGGREVIYGSQEERKNLNVHDRLFFQTLSKTGAAWQDEKEWRFKGDFDLDNIFPEELIVLVRTEQEKQFINEHYPYQCEIIETNE
ncbi:hypothetical protein K8I28_03265 [bacterium]|nr:hypothetical protein [bacterium]